MLSASVHRAWKRSSATGSTPVRRMLVSDPSGGVAPALSTAVSAISPSLNDGEIAWQAAAEVTDHCSRMERAAIYLALGCGDNFDAIVQMLAFVGRNKMALSDGLKAKLSRWLDGYAGTSHETSLRPVISRLPAHHR